MSTPDRLASQIAESCRRVENLKLDVQPESLKQAAALAAARASRQPGKISSVDARDAWRSYQVTNILPQKKQIKALCWDPEIANSAPFHNLVKAMASAFRTSWAKGLIYSIATESDPTQRRQLCHRWAIALPPTGNELLQKAAPVLVGPIAKNAQFINPEISVVDQTLNSTVGVDISGTALWNQLMNEAALRAAREFREGDLNHAENVLGRLFRRVSPTSFGECLNVIVADPRPFRSESVQDALISHVLDDKSWGDPRLTKGTHWLQAPEAANKFGEWLSALDIRQFFEVFVDDKSDSQGRKKFWLQYAPAVLRTRVFVGEGDQFRMSLLKNPNSPVFGILRGHKHTGFVMDFGTVAIVEFSVANNSAYIYKNKQAWALTSTSDAFRAPAADVSLLKNKQLVERGLAQQLRHVTNWQNRFSDELARMNIRKEDAA